jgi:hypothetical protein
MRQQESNLSHVAMEAHLCPVCGVQHQTGTVLLHKRMMQRLKQVEVTGVSLCPEHQRLHGEGYLALVGIDPAKSGGVHNATKLRPEDAYRTGEIVHIRREVFTTLFNQEAPTHEGEALPMVYVESGLIAALSNLQGRSSERERP